MRTSKIDAGNPSLLSFFFFNDTATTEIYTLPYTTLFRSAHARGPGGRARCLARARAPDRGARLREGAERRPASRHRHGMAGSPGGALKPAGVILSAHRMRAPSSKTARPLKSMQQR